MAQHCIKTLDSSLKALTNFQLTSVLRSSRQKLKLSSTAMNLFIHDRTHKPRKEKKNAQSMDKMIYRRCTKGNASRITKTTSSLISAESRYHLNFVLSKEEFKSFENFSLETDSAWYPFLKRIWWLGTSAILLLKAKNKGKCWRMTNVSITEIFSKRKDFITQMCASRSAFRIFSGSETGPKLNNLQYFK